jgi:hypothetical protein
MGGFYHATQVAPVGALGQLSGAPASIHRWIVSS